MGGASNWFVYAKKKIKKELPLLLIWSPRNYNEHSYYSAARFFHKYVLILSFSDFLLLHCYFILFHFSYWLHSYLCFYNFHISLKITTSIIDLSKSNANSLPRLYTDIKVHNFSTNLCLVYFNILNLSILHFFHLSSGYHLESYLLCTKNIY